MSGFLIHFGLDDCYRVPVLKEAGFLVEECASARRLGSALIDFPEAEAIAISESDEIEANEAMAVLLHSGSTAPLILFQGWNRCLDSSGFNLVVPPLTEPRTWLKDVHSLIKRSPRIPGQPRATLGGAVSQEIR